MSELGPKGLLLLEELQGLPDYPDALLDIFRNGRIADLAEVYRAGPLRSRPPTLLTLAHHGNPAVPTRTRFTVLLRAPLWTFRLIANSPVPPGSPESALSRTKASRSRVDI